jgi:hypothetical protein
MMELADAMGRNKRPVGAANTTGEAGRFIVDIELIWEAGMRVRCLVDGVRVTVILKTP